MNHGESNNTTSTTSDVSIPSLSVASLEEATSLAHFESTATDRVIHEIACALRNLLRQSEYPPRSNGQQCVVSYDGEKVKTALHTKIHWHELFLHYDRTQSTKPTKWQSTPLGIVTMVITEHTTVWPMACHGIMFQVGWEQILQYCLQPRLSAFRERGDYLTPSQRLVWDALLRLCQHSKVLQKQLDVPRLQSSSQSSRTASFGQCQVLFRMLQELSQQMWCRRATMYMLALRVLQQSNGLTNHQTDGADAVARDVGPAKRSRIIRRNPRELSADYSAKDYDSCDENDHVDDDDDDDDDINNDNNTHHIPKQTGFKSPNVTLPRVLQQDARSQRIVTLHATSQLHSRVLWKRWRKDVVGFIMKQIKEHLPNNNLRQLVDSIGSVILENPKGSSLLRFVLLRVLSDHPDHLQEWTLGLLQHFENCKVTLQPSENFALQCYSEIVTEMSVFDDAGRLQIVTAPLMKLLIDASERRNDWKDGFRPRLLKRAFVHLLSKRRKLLDSIPCFAGVKANISIAWPSVCEWVDSNMSRAEESRTITVLQQSGILGVFQVSQFYDSKRSTTQAGDGGAADDEWPFEVSCGVLLASTLCGEDDVARQMFSSHESEQEAGHANRNVKSPSKEVGNFVANHLHGDVLLRVFGYMGFKRMAHVGLVCKDWKDLADSPRLWQSYYQTRYGTLEDDTLSKDPGQPWKRHFHHRFIVEREVRSRTSTSTSRKLRVCKYIGCNEIVSSELQLERHHLSHKRRDQKEARSKAPKSTTAKPAKRKRSPLKSPSKKQLKTSGSEKTLRATKA